MRPPALCAPALCLTHPPLPEAAGLADAKAPRLLLEDVISNPSPPPPARIDSVTLNKSLAEPVSSFVKRRAEHLPCSPRGAAGRVSHRLDVKSFVSSRERYTRHYSK